MIDFMLFFFAKKYFFCLKKSHKKPLKSNVSGQCVCSLQAPITLLYMYILLGVNVLRKKDFQRLKS